ncbi:hypothetical protein [Chitinophaga niastensis]|nr:hypothetical protein [Chitinophaga niastensis]
MKKMCMIFMLMALATGIKAQNDENTSIRLGQRGAELMEMSSIMHQYVDQQYFSCNMNYDFADSAHQATVLEHATGMFKIHNNLLWNMRDSVESLQGEQYMLVVDHHDSAIYIYPRQPYQKFIDAPLLDSSFNQAFLKDLKLTTAANGNKTLSIYFNPGMQYSQMDLVYNPTTYLLSKISYYYSTVVFGGEKGKEVEKEKEKDNRKGGDEKDKREEKEPQGKTMTGVINMSFSDQKNDAYDLNIFAESNFIYQVGQKFYAQKKYEGYKVIPVM